MTPHEIRQLAHRQLADYDARTPGQAFSQPLNLSVAEAYAIQTEVARLREERGERVCGYKVGCISRAIQEQLGIDQPIFGRLFESEIFAVGAQLSCRRFANLAIEGEFALRLRRDLSPADIDDEKLAAAVESVFPIIELHHYILRSAQPSASELIANNGMQAGVVLPEGWPGLESSEAPAARAIAANDSLPTLRIYRNHVEVDSIGSIAAKAGPLASLRWLAGRLAELGLSLTRGQLILTGSPMKLLPVTAGDHILVEAGTLGKSWAEVSP